MNGYSYDKTPAMSAGYATETCTPARPSASTETGKTADLLSVLHDSISDLEATLRTIAPPASAAICGNKACPEPPTDYLVPRLRENNSRLESAIARVRSLAERVEL